MKSRIATLLLFGVLAAVVGCPAQAPTTTNTKAASNTKAKSPAPAGSKAPAGSSSAKPTGSPSPGATATASPPAGSASASPTPAPGATTSATPSVEAAPMAVTVLIKGMAFQPERVTVKQGGTITFINRDTAPHSVIPDGNTAFTASEILAAPAGGAPDGGVAAIPFAAAGEVKYMCGLHASMKGTVVVAP